MAVRKSATSVGIPEDIDRIATDIVRSDYSGENQEPDWLLYLAIARAITAERAAGLQENKRYRMALTRLGSNSPIGIDGEIQGQSDIRMRYARNVVGGGPA